MKPEDIEKHASSGVLRFCGSMLVLSISFKVIGVDLAPLFHAYSAKLEAEISEQHSRVLRFEDVGSLKEIVAEQTLEIEELKTRVIELEASSHPPRRQ